MVWFHAGGHQGRMAVQADDQVEVGVVSSSPGSKVHSNRTTDFRGIFATSTPSPLTTSNSAPSTISSLRIFSQHFSCSLRGLDIRALVTCQHGSLSVFGEAVSVPNVEVIPLHVLATCFVSQIFQPPSKNMVPSDPLKRYCLSGNRHRYARFGMNAMTAVANCRAASRG